MKKKISIAQALLGSPPLVILDEPTSGLDPESSIQIQKLIQRLNNEGITFFLTSHNLHEIERICDRIAILQDGKIKRLGTVQELKSDYQKTTRISISSSPILMDKHLEELGDPTVVLKERNKKQAILEIVDDEVITKLLKIMLANEYKIYEINNEKVTLEEIFLDI